MANVTSICEELERIGRSSLPPEQLLAAVIAFLQSNAGVSGYFCRIWGQRWSFWVGDRQLAFAPEKLVLNSTLGFCYQNGEKLAAAEWEQIQHCLQAIFKDFRIE